MKSPDTNTLLYALNADFGPVPGGSTAPTTPNRCRASVMRGSSRSSSGSRRIVDTILVFSYSCVMKNVTVTLPEDTARWVRIWAAEQGKSVSAALADLIDERRHDRETRERAVDQFRSVPKVMLGPAGQRYPSRESVHER